jgi:hypothetical protein
LANGDNRRTWAAAGVRMATRWAARQDLNDEHKSLVTNRALREQTPSEFLVPLSIVLVESYADPKCVARSVTGQCPKIVTTGDSRVWE